MTHPQHNQLPPFTDAVKQCHELAGTWAQQQHKNLGNSHLLAAILTHSNNAIFPILNTAGAKRPGDILAQAHRLTNTEPPRDPNGQQVYTQNFLSTFQNVPNVMKKSGDTIASLEIIIAAMAGGNDPVGKLLNKHKITQTSMVQAIADVRSTNPKNSATNHQLTHLKQFGENLTEKAKQGKLDPVIGRDTETRRVMQILARRTKNNPVVTGEPGTGKAQPLDANILTPTGWKRMGDMRVGDMVLTPTGDVAHVDGVFPQGRTSTVRVACADGRSTRADLGHLWKTYVGGNDQPEIITTRQIQHHIQQGTPVWIDLPRNLFHHQRFNTAPNIPLWEQQAVKLLNSGELSSTVCDTQCATILRVMLGMLDTTVSAGRTIVVRNSPKHATQQLTHMVRRLGMVCTVTNTGVLVHGDWVPFIAGRTNQPPHHITVDRIQVTSVSQPSVEETQCIHLDSDEHLYVTDGFMVTHNTAIIEGLARRIATGDCPEQLKNKHIYTIDLAALSAGATHQGEYEQRIKNVLEDVRKANNNIITFIDEIHMIAHNDGSPMNLANMLKPMLARGELRLIGATTPAEYRKFIEGDAALERRFQQVHVAEPTVEDTIGILRGVKDKYETHHGIKIQDAALVACAELSKKYINGRFLPDKAIDLMDESASRLKMLVDSRPEDIDVAEREVRRLEIEEVALSREETQETKQRLQQVRAELANKREILSSKKAVWMNAQKNVEHVKQLRETLEKLKQQSEVAEREGNYDLAASIQFDKIPKLREQLQLEEQNATNSGVDSNLIAESVTPDIVADVVSLWTGIPAAKMTETETQKILSMGENITRRVVGQPKAVDLLVRAIKKSRAGINDPQRPIGSFLFAGPSGTGKALPNTTPVHTTQGVKTMGQLVVGDTVFNRHGQPTPIVGVFPQGDKPVWELCLEDGRSLECCPQHLWLVTEDKGDTWHVWDTETIRKHPGVVHIPRGGMIVDAPHLGTPQQRGNLLKEYLVPQARGWFTHPSRGVFGELAAIAHTLGWVVDGAGQKMRPTVGDGEHLVRVVGVSETGGTAPMTCVRVADPGGTFLAGADCVVTHNTEISKALAEFLFDDEKSLIVFSMEEYSDGSSVNKLIGSPAGYVGYGDTPALEAVRQKPSAVVLFDELEKANDQVITTLLSVLEEGKITLSNGREVLFNNTVIIFTSNLGAGELDQARAERVVRSRLRPEFLNRLDGIVMFNPLDVDTLKQVVDIQLDRLQATVSGKNITLHMTEAARDWAALAGFDPMFGARPVRRIIHGDVADMLADAIIRGYIPNNTDVVVDVNHDGSALTVTTENEWINTNSGVQPDTFGGNITQAMVGHSNRTMG